MQALFVRPVIARTVIILTSLPLVSLFFVVGCGPGSSVPSALGLDTWVGVNGPTASTDGQGTQGSGGDGAPTGLVAGETDTNSGGGTGGTTGGGDTGTGGGGGQANDPPVLYVSPATLQFGQSIIEMKFTVRNAGGGTMQYTATPDVAWATVNPASGTNTGKSDWIKVRVDRSQETPGNHSGSVIVSTDDGQSKKVTVTMTVPAPNTPNLSVSTGTLDFGPSGMTETFTLRNTGGGTLAYSIVSDVNWLTVQPDHGTLLAQTDTIQVQIDRNWLVIGTYAGHVTVHPDPGQTATLTVGAEKAVTAPLIIPWLEVNLVTQEEIDNAVAGLLVWHRITDTALVSTVPDREWLYTQLRARLPGMTILSGIKTVYRLGQTGFTSPSGWQAIAASVAAAAATSGQPHVLLENETALAGYWYGGYEIDFDLLRADLALLPRNVEIIWFPLAVTRDEYTRGRTRALTQLVQSALDCRFVDSTFCHPGWPEDPDYIDDRLALEAVARKPTTPIIYFGQFKGVDFWGYDDVHAVMQYLAGRPDVYFYASDWTGAAAALAARFPQGGASAP